MTDTTAPAIKTMIARLKYLAIYSGDVYCEAAAMLEALLAEREWRPMDSAPRTGEIILNIPKTDFNEGFSCAAEFMRGDWYFANCDPSNSNPIAADFDEPIGWLPLPSALPEPTVQNRSGE